MQYPKIMQPTHARWECVPLLSAEPLVSHDEAENAGDLMNGILAKSRGSAQQHDTIFPKVPDVYTRKFMVSDTYYETAPTSTFGYPGPDEAMLDVGPLGLSHVLEDVIAELPVDCRQAFHKAKEEETSWKNKWRAEGSSDARAKLKITYNM